jgi:hypothetical protein
MVISLGQCGPNAHVPMDYYFEMVVEPWRPLLGPLMLFLEESWRAHSSWRLFIICLRVVATTLTLSPRAPL